MSTSEPLGTPESSRDGSDEQPPASTPPFHAPQPAAYGQADGQSYGQQSHAPGYGQHSYGPGYGQPGVAPRTGYGSAPVSGPGHYAYSGAQASAPAAYGSPAAYGAPVSAPTAYGAPVSAPTAYGAYPMPGSTLGSAPTGTTKRRGRRVVLGGVVALAIAVVGGGVGAAAVGLSDRNTTTTGTKATAASAPVQTVVNSANTSISTLVKAVDPVVVSLTVTGANEEDEGSGIVLKSTGVILTNNHVISAAENGGTVEVTFTDGSTAPATIVAADASEDLAIVQATGVSGLATATLADSNSVQVGDSVVAIGNELGLSNSVSSGIVSALHRKVSVASENNTPMQGGRNFNGQNSSGTTYGNAIQTDAAINQGDSGGALFNMQGQVIGIDSAIATGDSGSSGSVGIGFAIAINDAKAFINANT